VEDIKAGVYLPFGMVLKAEGGAEDPEALKAARLHATRCAELGAPYIQMNPMTDRLEYLHFQHQKKEVLQRAWSLHERRGPSFREPANDEAEVLDKKARAATPTPCRVRRTRATRACRGRTTPRTTTATPCRRKAPRRATKAQGKAAAERRTRARATTATPCRATTTRGPGRARAQGREQACYEVHEGRPDGRRRERQAGEKGADEPGASHGESAGVEEGDGHGVGASEAAQASDAGACVGVGEMGTRLRSRTPPCSSSRPSRRPSWRSSRPCRWQTGRSCTATTCRAWRTSWRA